MKKINYYVIGGQYASFCYGGAPTLIGAKRLARKSAEYWDNWQGWHIPRIYKAEDVEDVNNFYGDTKAPTDGAMPVAWAWYNNGQPIWEEIEK